MEAVITQSCNYIAYLEVQIAITEKKNYFYVLFPHKSSSISIA